MTPCLERQAPSAVKMSNKKNRQKQAQEPRGSKLAAGGAVAADDRSGASMPGRAGSSNRATHCPGASGPQNADEYVHMNVFFL